MNDQMVVIVGDVLRGKINRFLFPLCYKNYPINSLFADIINF